MVSEVCRTLGAIREAFWPRHRRFCSVMDKRTGTWWLCPLRPKGICSWLQTLLPCRGCPFQGLPRVRKRAGSMAPPVTKNRSNGETRQPSIMPFQSWLSLTGTNLSGYIRMPAKQEQEQSLRRSRKWSRKPWQTQATDGPKTDEKKLPTDRECLAVLWAIEKFASDLQAKEHSPSSRIVPPLPCCSRVRLSPRSHRSHFGLCSTTWSSSGSRGPNINLPMHFTFTRQ